MKLKNIKSVKTTVMAIVGGLLMIAGILWPDKIDAETGEIIKTSIDEIVTGVGAIMPVIAALFAKDE